ncbi:hypothetical protein AKJ64_04825 [candidate division MSBL1 archaeon SCGC-AAA259E17]|uniref:PAS domain S-box protein n=1 Tax=candidate division MSBL1 archaeon SCGC-AAA259E17 TaxID=1698263 RepID=A0A133UAU0_9EURY|nr:hypothetical protein AKJ64_04825 [candidate division MSBL1 archaeon SCGC-AAA259E17]
MYASDITDLKKTEEKLEKERDLLNKITETSPVGITVLDTEGQIVFANEEAERVLGLPEEEVTRRTFDDAKWKITDYEGDPFPKEELPFRKVMETKEPVYDVRHAIEWPSGERKLLSVNAAPIFDSTGDLDKIVATIENVTEREQNRRKLQESNLQLEAIFNDPEVFVGILDSDGTVLKANEAALAFVGASHSEIEGEKFWNTPWWEHSPELQEKLRKGIERAKTGEIVRFEATHIGKNEKEITVDFSLRPVRDEDNNIPQLIAVGKDITDRKEVEEKIRELNQFRERIIRDANIFFLSFGMRIRIGPSR